MEMEEIQGQACNFPRVGNSRNESSKIGSNGGTERFYPGDEEDGELKRVGGVVDCGANRLRGWHHSSRIIRVSRASGGKDRHSKVWTSKGLRDRRVRLSVTTAIQFYDLQDRLGYDQPSKAVEWLIKKAADAIAELPSLNHPFPDSPNQQSDEKRGTAETEQRFNSADLELDGEPNYQQNQSQHLSLSKSACSSTSENSKGSNMSLSKPDSRVQRVKARERARERTAKEKEKEKDSRIAHHQNVNPISQNASFTELLTCGIGNVNNINNATGTAASTSPSSSIHQNQPGEHEASLFHKAARQWPSAPLDYFTSGLLGPSSSRTHQSSGFSGLGNPLAQTLSVSPYNVNAAENQSDQLQHFSLVPDHLIPVVSSQPSGGEYNLNFSISSSGLAGFNRGTLQSNSPPFLPHVQRFPPVDGSNVPFYIGTAAPSVDNNHHPEFPPGFDGRLQLYYGDGGGRHSDEKGKGKN